MEGAEITSFSRIPIRIEIEKIGEFEGELIRFHAPSTVQQIIKSLPLEGAGALWDYAVYFQTDISRGLEKQVSRVKAGDILYWPPRRYILLAYAEAAPPAQMMKIGEFKGDFEKLKNLRPGARIRIAKV